MEKLNSTNIDNWMQEQFNANLFEGCQTKADVNGIVIDLFNDSEFVERLEDLDYSDVLGSALGVCDIN